MKTKFIFSLLLSLNFCFLSSQIPQGFNYQAVARDGSGNPIVGATIDVKLGIQADTSATPVILWEEQHSGVKTNAFGLFIVTMGTGIKTDGSAATFSAVNWSVIPLYLKTQIFYNSAWKYMGSSKLWSVPYANIANDLGGPVKKLAVTGTTSVMDEALFEVINKNGQTVFAVYNEGVRVYVDNGVAKGLKGGFAIGGFGTGKGTSQPLFVVNYDSIRAYIAPDAVKGLKGGFAIGGFDPTKAVAGEEYLVVTRDSSRIYVKEQAKGLKGGFAIGSFNPAKGGTPTSFTSLTRDNYLIGHSSGKGMTTGKFNSFLGYETGIANTSGGYNTILGYQSGYKNNADFNVFLGYQSGYNNTGGISNTFLGHLAGFMNSSGNSNVFLGDSSGFNNLAGKQNIFLGNGSGKANNGDYNAFIGYQTGYRNLTGTNNSFIGYQAGYKNETGNNNAFIGYQAGWKTYKGSKNVFIGYQAGFSNTGDFEGPTQPGNNNIYIGEECGYNNITGRSNVYIGDKAGLGLNPINAGSPPIYNVYIGYMAGYKEYQGTHNTFIGYQAGYTNYSGNYNTFIGYKAGYSQNTGSYNTIIGYNSGVQHTDGGSNLFMGTWSGFSNLTGTGNVFLGYDAGYYETGSSKLFIDNIRRTNEATARVSSLIYGEFSTTVASQVLSINGKLGVKRYPAVNFLEVEGDASKTTAGMWLANSDSRIKTEIQPIADSYELLLKLKPVRFKYTDEWKQRHPDIKDRFYYNFIAQDYKQVFPESVTGSGEYLEGDNAELLQLDTYSSQIVTLKAVQDLIIENRQQQKEIEFLKLINDEKENRIKTLETVVLQINDLKSQLAEIQKKMK